MKRELINSVNLSKVNSAEHLSYHTEAKVFMDRCGAESINCTTEFEDYDAAIVAEKENMRRQQASPITPMMNVIDSERDTLILFLYSLLDAGRYSPVEEVQIAYQALHPAMQPYRGIGYNTNIQESADILAFVTEITAPALVAHTVTMGMTDGIAMLTAKNQEYIDLDIQRVSEMPSKKDTADIRNRTNEIYTNIVTRANSTIVLTPNDAAAMLATNMNNLIDRTIAAYKQRLSIVTKNNAEKKAAKAALNAKAAKAAEESAEE